MRVNSQRVYILGIGFVISILPLAQGGPSNAITTPGKDNDVRILVWRHEGMQEDQEYHKEHDQHGSQNHDKVSGVVADGMPNKSHIHLHGDHKLSAPDIDPNETFATPLPPGSHAMSHHHDAPKLELDQASLSYWHGPPPLSYLYYGWILTQEERVYMTRMGLSPYGNATTEMSTLNETALKEWQISEMGQQGNVMDGDGREHKLLLIFHVATLSGVYFFGLPIVLAFRTVGYHSKTTVTMNIGLVVLLVLGWLTGISYRRRTPQLYRGHRHNAIGNLIVFTTIALMAVDTSVTIRRFFRCRSSRKMTRSDERIALNTIDEDLEEEFTQESTVNRSRMSNSLTRHSLVFNASDTTLHNSSSPPIRGSEDDDYLKLRRTSGESFEQLRIAASPLDIDRSVSSLSSYAYRMAFHFMSRFMVIGGFVAWSSGIIIYTGIGREGYISTLLAHLIKGSIFFWYGILSFSRYLGAWSEYGWAWNARSAHRQKSKVPSAEFVESAVIFAYGASNTWLERIGAQPGSPYTLRQVQHISIAIMFWFAGLIGMCLESKSIRRFLTTGSVGVSLISSNRDHTGRASIPFRRLLSECWVSPCQPTTRTTSIK